MAVRTISDNCIKLVKHFEGCKLTAYKDEVGVWTIGYGITNADKKITDTTIKRGKKFHKKRLINGFENLLSENIFH